MKRNWNKNRFRSKCVRRNKSETKKKISNTIYACKAIQLPFVYNCSLNICLKQCNSRTHTPLVMNCVCVQISNELSDWIRSRVLAIQQTMSLWAKREWMPPHKNAVHMYIDMFNGQLNGRDKQAANKFEGKLMRPQCGS